MRTTPQGNEIVFKTTLTNIAATVEYSKQKNIKRLKTIIMKKLFLFIGIITMAFGLMAKEVPNVIVHKHNGGLQAIINCYNDVTYTPSTDENQPATLDCGGTGWTFCRVPSLSFTFINPSDHSSNMAADKGIASAINQIIEFSEKSIINGEKSGSTSVTVATPTYTRCSNTNSYFVKGTWRYNQYGEGDLYIYITPANNLVKIK